MRHDEEGTQIDRMRATILELRRQLQEARRERDALVAQLAAQRARAEAEGYRAWDGR